MDKDKISGKATEAKGAVRETIGKLAGNNKMRAESAAHKASGKTRSTLGDAKHKLRGLFGR